MSTLENEGVETTVAAQSPSALKLELLRTQERLHQLQEASISEPAFIQLRSQYLLAQYELWIMKACVAWDRGNLLQLTQCLEASLDCTALDPKDVVSDWIKRLEQFASEACMGVVLSEPALQLETVLNTQEWLALIERVFETGH